MDYRDIRDKTIAKLLAKGAPAILKKAEVKFDKKTSRQSKVYKNIDGVAVKSKYESEAIGQKSGVIEAGDVKFLAYFTESPTETVDRIEFAGKAYNVIHVDSIEPDGATTILYIIQGRKV